MAILRNGKNTLKYKTQAEVKAEARVKAEAEAEAKAKAKAKAEMQKKLDNKTDKVLYAWQYSVGPTPTITELAVLIQCYSDADLLVPDFLTTALCNMVKKFKTTNSYVQHIPVYDDKELTSQSGPCACELDDKWADDKWYQTHASSGQCHAYKPWI